MPGSKRQQKVRNSIRKHFDRSAGKQTGYSFYGDDETGQHIMLSFEWTEPPTGVDKITTGDALKVVMSDDIRYRNDYYGILAVVQEKGKTGDQAKYQLKTYASEEAYAADKNNYEETFAVLPGKLLSKMIPLIKVRTEQM